MGRLAFTGPGHIAGLNKLRYFNLARNKLHTVRCGTFNQVQSSLNYLNTSFNDLVCGIQKYKHANPVEGIDATVKCQCPLTAVGGPNTGAMGFCEIRVDTCEYAPPLLQLRAKALEVGQSWRKISAALTSWVSPTHHTDFVDDSKDVGAGQIGGVDDTSEGNVATDEGMANAPLAGAFAGVAFMALVVLVVAAVVRRRQQNEKHAGAHSEFT